jgi:arylsulfatase A-like enzyme
MRRVALIASVVFGTASIGAHAQPRTSSSPNVVLIITDDVGYGDLGSYGATDIRTPNIDRLAKEGVRFTDFYANGAVCSPTRAALITGRYQQRVAIENVVTPADKRGLPATGRSLPQLLKNHGYATALIGKWHLGYQPEVGPNAHGFDYFFGFLSGAVNYYHHYMRNGSPDLYENTTPVTEPGYLTDMLTRRSVDFIDRNAQRPFFLEVAYNAAHWPFQSPHHSPDAFPKDRDLFQGPDDVTKPTRKDYAEILERADAGVGHILGALDRHGLAANTLVIFTNDNGGEWLSRNAPLFNRKGTLWEGGIRVAAIMRWPGHVPGGTNTDQVGITMDLTATILAATNTPVPREARLDGIDLVPLVQAIARPSERTLFWRFLVPARQHRAVRSGNWKLMRDGEHLLLFDLRNDPGERNDLSQQRPDLVAALRAQLLEWETQVEAEAKTTTAAGSQR